MKDVDSLTVLRIMLGAIFLVFGLDGFFHFLPLPEPEAEAGAFMGALGASGYMFPMIKVTELSAAVLLILNRYMNLALVLLAPIVINILAMHFFLAPSGLPVALVTSLIWGYLVWKRKENYMVLLDK